MSGKPTPTKSAASPAAGDADKKPKGPQSLMDHFVQVLTCCVIFGFPLLYYYIMTVNSKTGLKANADLALYGYGAAAVVSVVAETRVVTKFQLDKLLARVVFAAVSSALLYFAGFYAHELSADLRVKMVGARE